MIRTIQINGFKSIESASVELGRVNCFIGANGVGKSNILEAIGVLGAAATVGSCFLYRACVNRRPSMDLSGV